MSSSEGHRRAESLRLRKYRAQKKVELNELEKELWYLQGKLAQLQAARRGHTPHTATPTEHKALHDAVEKQTRLIRILSVWVASQTPEPSLVAPTAHATLLDDPSARLQGYYWLSNRVYHTATTAFPSHPFGSRVDDSFQFQMHVADADGDGPIVTGMETHVQHTFFTSLDCVKTLLWSCEEHNRVQTYVVSSSESVDHVSHHLVYYGGVYQSTNTRVRRLVCLFEDTDRVVFTYVLVAHDERFPMAEGEVRTHGFSWTIAESVTDHITLVRHSTMHFAPVTRHGVASLQDIGRLYGQSADGARYRQAYVERIRSVAEIRNRDQYRALTSSLSHLLDQI
ncbi:Aste57867_16135 [Aphanomyces stellatus]|uniref:Aste57867_16135 protein n=1 Tax=Aphanomyces stellatus TaxID=120398 RepID=A0A485L510_9STRA|nr:hypothetical protein As57867_016079 [Aphanomyces stellatus]VFT92915.1 Aste57867_16135 [Aphanomyces stellatus]